MIDKVLKDFEDGMNNRLICDVLCKKYELTWYQLMLIVGQTKMYDAFCDQFPGTADNDRVEWNTAAFSKVSDMYRRGVPVKKIAHEFNTTSVSIYEAIARLRRMGVPVKRGRRCER